MWDEGDRKEIAQNLKESINPIRIIGNSVLRNEFSENLGKALAELCNTLTRFYNFITSNSDGERPSLQGGESRDDTPKFVSIDETGEQFEQLSDEDWQAIDAIFISSVSSANSSMEKTYKDINARIEKLKADDKTESESKEKSTALSFESTEANVDIINELVRHGLVSEGDWDYDPINIFSSNGLKGLQQTIATTKKFVSEASKDLLREQVGEAFNKKGLVTEEGKLEKNPLTIFKNARGIFGERKTNIKAMEEQKDWFRTLDSILKNANSELEKYKKDDSVINLQKIIDNSDEDFELDANEVAPFIGRMDGIITPILRYIIVACNQGGIDKLKNYKEFTTSNIDETESTEYNIGDLAQKFISYIHDPASAGIDDFEFEDKTKMSQTELYAYYKQREKHLAAQKTSKEQKRNELINLLMMTRSLTDTESLAIENELIKNKKTATGRFDSNNSTHDFFGSDGHSSHDINDSMPEEEKEGADLEKVNSDYRETLRLIGIIAQKYNLSKYRYASGTESHRSIQKLESGATNQRRPTIESIFRFMNNFVTTLEEKSLNGTPEKALAKALKDYAGNNGKNKPTDFDSAKEAYLAKLPQHGTEDLMTCPDKTFFTIVATLFKGQPSNEPQKTQAKTKPQK